MARSQHPGWLGATLALLVLTSGVLLAGPVPAAPAAEGDGRLLLVMDSSGSMKEPTPSVQTKIAAA
jgi:Ca-activated chloride channel family protein